MTRHWDEETGREADALYRTFSEAKIRRYQDLADQQIATAYAQRKDDALSDLQAMRDALSAEMMRRSAARDRRQPVLFGLRIERRNAGWAVVHDGSGLEAASGLRQRRFAEQARENFLSAGVDFTRPSREVSADRKLWADVYYRWQQRARQRSFDDVTFEYYSGHVPVGTFVPSAQWAAGMRAARDAGDSETMSRMLRSVPWQQADAVTMPA